MQATLEELHRRFCVAVEAQLAQELGQSEPRDLGLLIASGVVPAHHNVDLLVEARVAGGHLLGERARVSLQFEQVRARNLSLALAPQLSQNLLRKFDDLVLPEGLKNLLVYMVSEFVRFEAGKELLLRQEVLVLIPLKHPEDPEGAVRIAHQAQRRQLVRDLQEAQSS